MQSFSRFENEHRRAAQVIKILAGDAQLFPDTIWPFDDEIGTDRVYARLRLNETKDGNHTKPGEKILLLPERTIHALNHPNEDRTKSLVALYDLAQTFIIASMRTSSPNDYESLHAPAHKVIEFMDRIQPGVALEAMKAHYAEKAARLKQPGPKQNKADIAYQQNFERQYYRIYDRPTDAAMSY